MEGDVLHVRKPKWFYVKILRCCTAEIKESNVALRSLPTILLNNASCNVTDNDHHVVQLQGFHQLKMAVELPIIFQSLHA